MTLGNISIIKTIGIWFVLLGVAVGLGAVRTYLLVPRLGELRGHQVGTIICCTVFMMVFWFAYRRTVMTGSQALLTGLILVIMTVIFEFGFFHFVSGRPWDVLLADYNIIKGRLWILVLLTTLLGPWIVKRTSGH